MQRTGKSASRLIPQLVIERPDSPAGESRHYLDKYLRRRLKPRK